MPLTIKNYKVGGLSEVLKEGQIFDLQGPMGKGLGLSPTSVGNHVAFAAGTGILVYIDLVLRLLLSKK